MNFFKKFQKGVTGIFNFYSKTLCFVSVKFNKNPMHRGRKEGVGKERKKHGYERG